MRWTYRTLTICGIYAIVLTMVNPLNQTACGAGAVEESLALDKGQLYLIFDPRLHGAGQNCELKVHPFKRHPLNPLIRPGTWDTGGWWECGTVLWDQEQGLFKMWYSGGRPPEWRRYTCYATSKDGVHWEKPSLGIYEVGGSKQNNVCLMGAREASVYHDPRAADPAERYRMWGMDKDRCTYWYHSPDGVHWEQGSDQPLIPAALDKFWTPTYPGDPERELVTVMQEAGDRVFTYWFPSLEKFICFRKLNHPGGPPHRRFIRFESPDGLQWNLDSPTWALATDKEDEKFDPLLEFYGLGIHRVGDLYLMTTQLFHAARGDHGDVGLAYSIDSVKWHRPFRGQLILPRGDHGEWDWGWSGQGMNLVEKDGMWWLYYCGTTYTHYDKARKDFVKEPWGIGLARIPVGRIVSARCFRQRGTWTLGPVRLPGKHLRLNARVYKHLRVTVLDEQGSPISGLESTIENKDGLDLPVTFDNGKDLSALSDRAVMLRFDMDNAEVFGFRCE